MPKAIYTEEDLVYVRLIRARISEPWETAKAKIIEELPEGYDPELIAKFVDERPEPGIYINPWGIEPRFYPHRKSKRLLEFYRSIE
ncbi:MAG: hypothetical protein ACJAZ9_001544 [Neolewinella sp.]|jgi:hypothetical protein